MDLERRMHEINITSLLILIAFLSSRQYANGLSCYVCQSNSPSSSCITDPDTSNTCNYKYCTIYRRELAEPDGIVTAFYRACEDNPLYLNTKVSTPFATTYYRACTSDLCNVGDGIEGTASVNVEMVVVGDSIIVPGIANGVANDAFSVHTGTICAFLLIGIAYALAILYE